MWFRVNLVVQHLTTRLYLDAKGEWVKLVAEPARFANAVKAISCCIQHGLREVRLVQAAGTDKERYFYPFGADPAIKAERKKLRRQLEESRRLQRERYELVARLDALAAGIKEGKKKLPFRRKSISEDA